MNSGKSDTLIKTAFNYEERGLQVVTIKPSVDTKGDDLITSRGGYERPVDILATPEMDVRQEVAAQKLARGALHCVLSDESQFLTHEQIGQLFEVAKYDDISVIAYGLKVDFRAKLFEGSRRLFELADNIEKLPTMCRCNQQAEFNIRMVNGKVVFEGDTVAIDGKDEVHYDSLCGSCYVQEGGQI